MKKQIKNTIALASFALISAGLMQGCRADDAATAPTKPTIFVVGDSTARNNANGAKGWADPFADYFDPAKATVRNNAMAGRSTRTYTAENRWANVEKELKTGDLVLIQMGHNDGGPVGSGKDRASLPGLGQETQEVVKPDGSREIVHTYGWYLRKFVTEAQAKGATPILMSLTVRNLWRGDKVRRDNGNYAQWSQEIAQAQNVPFVDVTKIIADRYDAMGEQATKAMFGPDYVHTSPAGADVNAAAVVAGLKAIPNNRFLGLLSEKGKSVKPDGTLMAATAATGGVAAVVAPAQKPTLWMVGDSTMKVGTRGQLGWGDAVGPYFDAEKITVINRGRSARSSRSFRTEGLWENVSKELKPGDFVIAQFGHNDRGKPEGVYPNGRGTLKSNGDETETVETTPGTMEVVHSYGWYMRQYALETQAKEATAIVLSPIPYNRWNEQGKAGRETERYAKWSREAAQQTGAIYIDLNDILGDKYDNLGKDKMTPLFNDALHTNPEGADFNARGVIAGIKGIPELALNQYLSAKAAEVEPVKPEIGK